MAKQQYRVTRVPKKGGGEGTDTPWPWILLALNPLFIVNGVHTIDFYIKAIWISAVLVYTFWFTGRKSREREPLSFNVMELMWLGYMVWGVLSLLWVASPVLTFERLAYLGYPIAAYIVGKQTYFWRSARFWDVFAGVALLVGLIGCCMWWFAGTDPFGFDWIMSAGRPSSTLSYRAYAGTYMVTALPFLLWYMFSRHIKSAGHFTFVASSFGMTLLFLVYTRARSGWMGFAACLAVMAAMAVIYQVRKVQGDEEERKARKYFHIAYIASFILLVVGIPVYAMRNDIPLGPMFFVVSFATMAVLILIYQVCSRQGGDNGRKVERTFYVSLLTIVGLFGMSVALLIAQQSLADLSTYVLGGIVFAVGVVALGSMILTVMLGWRDISYKPALLVIFVATTGLSILPSNSFLAEADKNPQTLTGTGKEDLGNAITTIGKVLQSGSSDRVAFWQISRKMLFEKSVRGKYEGPGGMPHWVLGVGQNQWPVWVPLYSDILHSLGAEVHNDWIQAFVEGGPIGFFFWIGFTLALIYYAWRARDKDIMVAVMGCIFAWIFSTQTDFLTARIYGALWIGAIAAIAWGENSIRPVFTLGSLRPMPAFRIIAGVFFLWLGVAYAITMWADRQIFTTLVYRSMTVDQLVVKLFPLGSNPEDNFLRETVVVKGGGDNPMIDYTWGVGKYLIFSPINDLSRAISTSMQKGDMKNQTEAVFQVQKKIAREVLEYHPYQFSALQMMADINYRQKNYAESVKYNEQFLELRPNDHNMWLFMSQTKLEMGDSLNAAKAAYRAMELRPDVLQVQQFWQVRFKPEYRDAVLKQRSAK